MKRDTYEPGPARGAHIQRDEWALIVVRELRHPPAKVWAALTDPAQLAEWAPYEASANLANVGRIKLSTVGTPQAQNVDSEVTRAEPPRLLEHTWGPQRLRWELEPSGTGTKLTLSHNIDKKFISMGAAGWHICLDALDQGLGRIVGGDAMKHGWARLNAEYAKQFGVEPPTWNK
jgi:uncharacterized protein YndB with AHSA1/START domain